MVVVTIEMWPKGDEKSKYMLGRTYIWNVDQPGMPMDRGNYGVAVARKGRELEREYWLPKNNTRTGTVTNYPRLAYNVWRLVIRALKSAFPEEGK